MPPITAVGHTVARRLRACRSPPRLCIPPSGPAPVLTPSPFPSLARGQHGSAHPQFPRDPRLTVGLGEKILEISSQALEPSPAPVSQDSGFRVVSTFNATPTTASLVSVPGSPLLWKDPKLPLRFPEPARPAQPPERYSDQLSMLKLSADIEPSDSRPGEADIVAHASLLTSLYKICKGSNFGFRRISLRMTRGSLLVADDPLMRAFDSAQTPIMSAILKQCAEATPGLEESTHYRSVRFSLGHVSCVVQREVDVLCGTPPDDPPPSPSPSPDTAEPVVSRGSHPRAEPALIRVCPEGGRKMGPWMATFWLTRTPVRLDLGVGPEGTLTKVSRVDTTEAAGLWEKHDTVQVALRKLATLLSEMKRAVQAAAPDGQECIGILDKHLGTPTVRLFLPEHESKVGSGDIGDKPQAENTSHGAGRGLEGERQGPASPA